MIDGFPKRFFAKNVSQHAQDCSAPRIGISVEDGIGIAIPHRHYRPSGTGIPRLEVALLIAVHFIKKIVFAFVVFGPKRFKECGERFVEPDFTPVTAREQVAEPLMRKFVRDDLI